MCMVILTLIRAEHIKIFVIERTVYRFKGFLKEKNLLKSFEDYLENLKPKLNKEPEQSRGIIRRKTQDKGMER